MYQEKIRRGALLIGGFLGVWLVLRYLLPFFLPFALGLLLALAAEPAVGTANRLLKLPRWAASGLGVTLTLLLLVTLVGFLGAAAVKELSILAGRLPDLQDTLDETSGQLHALLQTAADRTPEGIRPMVTRSVDRLFSSGTALVEQATVNLPGAITGFLSKVPDGALGIGTGILSAFMLSVRLPRLKTLAAQKMPEQLRTRLLPALQRSKNALFGWLKAQLKLAGITYCIVTAGLLILGIPYAPLWAAAVALVDAVPLLGTGTVLIPWAVVCLFQRAHLRSIGLLCIYAAAFLTRTVLEPRLVGKQLGLDPLITLIFMYLGYRFWGFWGMLLSPMLAAALNAAGRATPADQT